uniref:FAD-dependent oxidoreductase n=1 Tax=Nocardia wallacei TaxID=480035 RepID=UPI002458C05B
MADAVVVGSGPNGLAAAVLLARAGLEVEVHEAADTVGGGCRTAELTRPGYRHDVCAGAHPLAWASPFLRAFDLAAHGVELLTPEASYAHPLDGGVAGVAWRDLDRTVESLGRDGAAWRRLFGPLVRDWASLVGLAMSDLRHPPLDVATGVRFARGRREPAAPGWDLGVDAAAAPALLTGGGAPGL